MKMTKAGLRALREACGMTQLEVADEFDVDITSVKRWENPSRDCNVPIEVFAWLAELYCEMTENAAGMAGSIAADSAGDVVLPYFRTQEELDDVQLPLGQDQPVGYFNAMTRKIADFLALMGVDVSFGYGDEATVVPFSDLVIAKMMEDVDG